MNEKNEQIVATWNSCWAQLNATKNQMPQQHNGILDMEEGTWLRMACFSQLSNVLTWVPGYKNIPTISIRIHKHIYVHMYHVCRNS